MRTWNSSCSGRKHAPAALLRGLPLRGLPRDSDQCLEPEGHVAWSCRLQTLPRGTRFHVRSPKALGQGAGGKHTAWSFLSPGMGHKDLAYVWSPGDPRQPGPSPHPYPPARDLNLQAKDREFGSSRNRKPLLPSLLLPSDPVSAPQEPTSSPSWMALEAKGARRLREAGGTSARVPSMSHWGRA